MHFVREIRFQRVKCLRAWGNLFHFTSSRARYFTMFDRTLFHILQSKIFHYMHLWPQMQCLLRKQDRECKKHSLSFSCWWVLFPVGFKNWPLEYSPYAGFIFCCRKEFLDRFGFLRYSMFMNGVSCVTVTIRPDPTWYFPFISFFIPKRKSKASAYESIKKQTVARLFCF